jgi:ribosomal protein L32
MSKPTGKTAKNKRGARHYSWASSLGEDTLRDCPDCKSEDTLDPVTHECRKCGYPHKPIKQR